MAQHRLAAVLKKKKISKRQLAKRLGIHYQNVFRMFHDSYDPKLSMLRKWAKVVPCRIRDLFEE